MKYIGLLSSDARGKNGGNVASRNRYGTYLRRHVAPVQPRSVLQMQNRQTFGSISTQWRAMSTANQAGWNTLASTVVFKDQLGQTYNPTGAQLFMLCSRNLIAAGTGAIATAPVALPAVPQIESLTASHAAGFSTASVNLTAGGTDYTSNGTFTVSYDTGSEAKGTYTAASGVITSLTLTDPGAGQTGSGTFAFSGAGSGATATSTLGSVSSPDISVAFTPTPVPAGSYLFLYATKPLSQGVTFMAKGQYRLMTTVAAATDSPVDISGTYASIFGTPPTTATIRVKAHYVDAASGYPGADTSTSLEW